MMFCIILIILDFSVLSRQNMKIKNAENKQTIKQYSAYACLLYTSDAADD